MSALLQRNPDSLEILPARWSAAREHVEAMCLVHLAHPESYVRAEVYQVRGGAKTTANESECKAAVFGVRKMCWNVSTRAPVHILLHCLIPSLPLLRSHFITQILECLGSEPLRAFEAQKIDAGAAARALAERSSFTAALASAKATTGLRSNSLFAGTAPGASLLAPPPPSMIGGGIPSTPAAAAGAGVADGDASGDGSDAAAQRFACPPYLGDALLDLSAGAVEAAADTQPFSHNLARFLAARVPAFAGVCTYAACRLQARCIYCAARRVLRERDCPGRERERERESERERR